MGIFGGRNIMVDLETLAKGASAASPQIGAVAFYPDEPGREFERFNVHVSFRSLFAAGRTIDPDTLLWWLDDEGAGPEARRAMVAGQRSDACLDLAAALLAFQDFCQLTGGRRALGHRAEPPARIWGHGPTFDVTILETAYADLGLAAPWSYKGIRDTRSIIEATGLEMGYPEQGGHIAVIDAEHQARRMLEAIAVLKGSGIRYPD